MKRFILVCVALIFMFMGIALFPDSAEAVDYSVIRVKLSVGTPTEKDVIVSGNYSIAESAAVPISSGATYTIKLQNGTLNLYSGSTLLMTNKNITFQQHTPPDGGINSLGVYNTTYNTTLQYLGNIRFNVDGSHIDVINYVYLEEYLYGVLPYEMSDSWPIEALKAQAVAARTYAVSRMGSGSYDVLDTSASQVYKGYNAGKVNSIRAVNETAKQVLKYQDGSGNWHYMPTYFTASNGGYTELPYHNWGGGRDLPFIISEDPYDVANPSSLSEEVFFPANITQDNPITTADNVSGTPNAANAVKYIKQRILDSGKLAAGGYLSEFTDDFELTGVLDLYAHTYDSGGSEDHSRIPFYGENNCVDFIKATGTFKVKAYKLEINPETGQQERVEYDVNVEDIELDLRYFDAANGDSTYQVFNCKSLRLFIIEAKMDGDTLLGYSIFQRRYGHGAGMSQRGAQTRAKQGQTYSEILTFYYPSTVFETLNISKPALTDPEDPADPTPTPPPDPELPDVVATGTVHVSTLNIRTGPSTSYSKLGNFVRGDAVNISQKYYTEKCIRSFMRTRSRMYMQVMSPLTSNPRRPRRLRRP